MTTIRPATPDDLPRITAIYEDAVLHGTATYELDPPTLAEMQERFRSIIGSLYPYLVAEEETGIVGYAYGGPFRARPAYRFSVENSIYVAPEAKGRGIGQTLMRELMLECERLGFRQILAVIGDGSPTSASVRLHERLGFTYCGTMVGTGYKHGRWLDTVLMQLSLNGGNGSAPDRESTPERLFRREK